MAMWKSHWEDHTSDWLKTVPISGLGQTMNACSRVLVGNIYGDHDVSCTSFIGIKHHHNVVRDTLANICYRSGISVGLDVCVDLTRSSPLTQTGLVDFVPSRAMIDVAKRKRDKYIDKCAAIGYGFLSFSFSFLGELEADAVTLLKRIRKFSMTHDIGARKDECLDVTCISSFAGMWVPSWAPEVALHNVVEKKKRKYASICEKNGYKFIAFAFSTFGEFDTETLDTLLRIKSIFIRHSNNANSGAFIFQRVSFCIQKEVRAQLVSRLPFNFM
nr:hypothetical protein [Tanacetum cinerariifolium]